MPLPLTPRRRPPIVVWALPAILLVYAAVALGVGRWWISGAGALVAAWLLWRRHPRARFAAYVLCSLVLVRGALAQDWWRALFGLVAILALQLPAARAAWPRIGVRMRRS
jgi:hypothetical protein